MKRIIRYTLLATFLMVQASITFGASLERGQELFESTKLGTNGKSCATCHPGGKKLEWAGTYEDGRLASITNACIQKALKGKPLEPGSEDMKSFLLYIRTFAGSGR